MKRVLKSDLYFSQNIITLCHCVKSHRIQSFSDPYFLVFGLNTERYFASLRIQSECGHFLHIANCVFECKVGVGKGIRL